ncbi:MAG: hypothetical protein LIO71_03565 [Ruminococcus sp.]|nr:hypothetical protein [Ruminococcus sp.]
MKHCTKYDNITISEFYCTYCGQKGLPIARRAGQQREAGHLKKLWCPNCNMTVNHVEVRPFGSYNYEDFKQEFELGRFIDGQRVPLSELIGCSKGECKYNVNGKCWNANHSYNCGHRIVIEQGPEHKGSGLERDR